MAEDTPTLVADNPRANGEEPSPSSPPSPKRSGQVLAVEFDFGVGPEALKSCREIELASVAEATEKGRFVWVDLDDSNPADAAPLLRRFQVREDVIERAMEEAPSTQLARYEDYLHLIISGCRLESGQLNLERVDVIMAQRFMITIHSGPVAFLQIVRREYRSDFQRFARSPSFLVYELWDHLLENYLAIQERMESRVETLQDALRVEAVDPGIFAEISGLGSDLLRFRKILLPARTVLTDLSTRKTLFVNEATQSFLQNMVGRLEHVLQDLLVDREILSESLNLYMSLVSHRTNLVMKRLTGVSVVFLPLTFLVGIYGMNFQHLPELGWRFGYAYFWLLVVTIVVVLMVLLRRTKML